MQGRCITFPTVLTLIRLVASLTILPFLLLTYLPLQDFWIAKGLGLFVLAISLSDFLDGYYARVLKQITVLGAMLDPLADKLFVTVSFICLSWTGLLNWGVTFVLVARELLLECLRYSARNNNFVLHVSSFGKWKSALQYIYLIVAVGAPWSLGNGNLLLPFEMILLVSMVLVSLGSAVAYGIAFLNQYNKVSRF